MRERARQGVRRQPRRRQHPGHRAELGQGHLRRRRCAPWSSSCSASSIFLSLYFEWKMALAAMIALLHDLVITAGLYSLVGFEVTPATVIGFLTILGYSLYDTVVVFDKVRENTAGPRRRQPDDLQRGGQPRGQPDPGPVDQHLDHRAAADRRDPVRRRRAARRRAAEGPVARAVRRRGRRRLLVDLHRDAAAGAAQGARAGDAGARQAGRRPRAAGTGVETPSARRRAAAAQPAADRPRRRDRRRADAAAVAGRRRRGQQAGRRPAGRPAARSAASRARAAAGGTSRKKRR